MTVVIDLFNTLRLALLIAPDVFGDIERFGGVNREVGPVDKLFGRLGIVGSFPCRRTPVDGGAAGGGVLG